MEGGWWFWALPQPTSTVDFHYAPIQYSHYIECMVCLMPSILDRYCWWKPHVSLDRIIIAWDHHYLFHLAAFAKWGSKWHLRGKSCWWQRERERCIDFICTQKHIQDQPKIIQTHAHAYIYIIIHIYITYHLITYLYEIDQCKTPLNHVESWCSLSFWETSPSSEFPFFVPPCDLRPFCASWSWSKL